jgi:hypothetical protein
VEVAVPGVEDVGDAHPVLFAELADPLEDGPELGARDDGVLHVVVVGDAAHRRERRLAALPEERPLLVVLGDPDLRGVVLLAHPYGVLELVLDLGAGPSSSTIRMAPAWGKPGWTAVSTASMHRESIISMAAGTIPAPMIPETGPPPPRVLEGREQGPHRLGLAHDAQGDLRRYPQSSLRADERAESS